MVYVPTCFPEQRVRVRKKRAELDKLPAGSNDVWKPNIVQKYEKRPAAFEGVCLADFASLYRPARGHNEYALREKPAVIRYRNYNPGSDIEGYMYEQVLLFFPFVSEAVDVLDGTKYVSIYEDNRRSIELKRLEYSPADDDAVVQEMVERHYADMLRLRRERKEEDEERRKDSC